MHGIPRVLPFAAATAVSGSAMAQPAAPQVKPTLVLVHAAFADSLSWNPVTAARSTDGYTATAAAIGFFPISYLGIAISLWPMIVPEHFTLWQAASSPSTQAFLLIGTLLPLPVILMYTAWSYWVFRGRIRGDIGYQ